MFAVKHVTLALAVCLAAASMASAEIPNGDFSMGDLGWNPQAVFMPAGVAEYSITDGVFSAHVQNSYLFDVGYWQCQQSDQYGDYLSNVSLAQMLPGEAGQLSFRAEAVFDDSSQNGLKSDGSQVTVTLNWITMNPELAYLIGSDSALVEGAWRSYAIELPSDVTANVSEFVFMLNVSVSSTRNLSDAAGQQGEVKTIDVQASFDDFGFIPEPASMMLLGAGAVALLRRRR